MSLTHALGWTLIHFLWQGALIAALLAVALAWLRGAGSRARYAAGCAAMVLMVVCAAATLLELKSAGSPSRVPALALLHWAPSIGTYALSSPLSGSVASDYIQ